jgi:4-amino-4-deoxy-L-arabinose transferase-like glycosyltransferase
MDRDEARFVQASRQMMETQNYQDIYFQETPRTKKPVGIYWLQSAAVNLLSHHEKGEIWAYRVPSVLGAWAAVLLTFLFGSRMFNKRVALVAAGLLASCVMVAAEAHLGKTDAVLLCLSVMTLGSLGCFYMQSQGGKAPPRWFALLFWGGLGFSILVKGPVVPMIVLLTLITLVIWEKRARWLLGLSPTFGLLLVLAIVLPWFVSVSGGEGGGFIGKSIQEDLIPKLLGGHESHGAPPGYFTLLITATLFPASLFLWPSLVNSVKSRAQPAVRFLLAWVLPAWVMFEIVPTKLPHYTLPVYPGLVLLIAATLFSVRDKAYDRLAHKLSWIGYGLWGLIGLVLVAGVPFIAMKHGDDGTLLWAIPVALGAAGAVVSGMFYIRKRLFLNAAGCSILAMVLVYPFLFQGVMPHLNDLWISKRVHAAIDAAAPDRPAALAAAGFHEPSLVFLMGTDTILTTGEGAAEYLLGHPKAIVLVDQSEAEAFENALVKQNISLQSDVETVAHITGLNYSRGKKKDITLYRLSAISGAATQ